MGQGDEESTHNVSVSVGHFSDAEVKCISELVVSVCTPADESATDTDSIFLAISLSGTPGPQTLIPASRDSLVTSHSSIPSSSWHQTSSRRKVSRSLQQGGR